MEGFYTLVTGAKWAGAAPGGVTLNEMEACDDEIIDMSAICIVDDGVMRTTQRFGMCDYHPIFSLIVIENYKRAYRKSNVKMILSDVKR